MKRSLRLGLTAAAVLVITGCQREQGRSTGQDPDYEFQREETGTGGSGDEGMGKMETRPPEGEVLPETGDELRPDERPALQQEPGTGGAGTSGMGIDAGTGGAGTSGMGMDAGMGGAGEQGTGGALIGGEDAEGERTEGGTGTEVLQPGETDARTGAQGTGGAGTGEMGADAGTSGFDNADGY